MADFKQAAKWMQEGKRVRQSSMDQNGWFEGFGGPIVYRNIKYPNYMPPDQWGWLFASDILADD